MREACTAEREAESQAELLEESGALDPSEPPDEAPAYEPDHPEPRVPRAGA